MILKGKRNLNGLHVSKQMPLYIMNCDTNLINNGQKLNNWMTFQDFKTAKISTAIFNY